MIDSPTIFRARGILYNLFNRGIPFHNDENINPFFIVGSGRCGSTLLRRILNTAEGVHVPPENWALSVLIFKFRRLRTVMNWDTLVDLTAAVHCQDTQGWFDQYPHEFVENLRKLPKNHQSLNRLVDQLYHYHATTSNEDCKRWGDKTPLNVNYMELILNVFPKSKFIHMLRDGVDVVYSWNQRELYRDSILKPARRWNNAVNDADKFNNTYPNKLLEVRYEDLVQNPSKTSKKVCQYLNIPFDTNMLKLEDNKTPDDIDKHDHYKNVLTPITDDHIGKGRRNLNVKEKTTLKKEINNNLRKFGYKPV